MYRVIVICPKNSLYLQFRKEADFTPPRVKFFLHIQSVYWKLQSPPPPARFVSTSYHAPTETYQICVLRAKPCLDIGNGPLSLKCTLIHRHFDLRRKAVHCNRKPMQIFNRKPMYIIL
jgi:hypothetical protein